MTDEPDVRRSPLVEFTTRFRAASTPGLGIREILLAAQIGVRGRVPGLSLPETPNTAADEGGWRTLWLGPDEWLLVASAIGPEEIERRLHDGGQGAASVVDLSAARAALELHGARAREVLAAGCTLDLHPRSFGPGHCAQTLLARAPVILDQLDGAPTYRILVRRSLAAYLAAWLLDAIALQTAAR